MIMDNFIKNLEEGQHFEKQVCAVLQKLLPDCKVINTEQTPGTDERERYHTCDVVVIRDDKVILGIECKEGRVPYRKAERWWGSKYNTPINDKSLINYSKVDFPMWVINNQVFANFYLAQSIDEILNTPSDHCYDEWKQVGRSKIKVWNFDSRDWLCKSRLEDIIKMIVGLC